jgi:hypothetical protein
MKDLLDELNQLTVIEQERKLSTTESNRYLEIWEVLKRNNIEVPFGVEIKNRHFRIIT